jgi:hypothetical protein
MCELISLCRRSDQEIHRLPHRARCRNATDRDEERRTSLAAVSGEK